MIDNYVLAVNKALQDQTVTVCVRDISMDYDDLEHSRDIDEIIEACEATDTPLICFHKNLKGVGNMLVMVGEGEESICDSHVNEFMDMITGE